jgi:type IV secretory pathway VirB6-like protein
MLRQRVSSFLSLLSGYRSKWIAICLVLLLSACGENCYEDENISDDGKTFYNKNYEHQVAAVNAEWLNTGIHIEAGDGFTIKNVQGQVSGCTNRNAVGSCAVFYATMCQDGQKYLCTDSECKTTKILNDCLGKSGCSQGDRCTGIAEKNKCVSGVLYNYDANKSEWVQNGDCMESVFCDSMGNKMLNTSYQIGSDGSNIEYKNVSTKIGTCSTNEIKCDNGHSYPISAQKSDWTQIDSNIQPGDDIHLSIMAPKASSGVSIGAQTSNVEDPSLNAWSKKSYIKKPGKNCPSSYPLSTAQSSYTSCGSLDKGYYTCPLCESSSSHVPMSGDTSKKCGDHSGESLSCWGVGGSGLWLKMIDSSESCSDSECAAPDCIWFNQDTTLASPNKFGDIYYIPSNSDGDGCDGDITKCTNRITKRNIAGPDGHASKICAKISGESNSYSDNAGGYTVYATRTTCIAKDGRPFDSLWGAVGLFGLEYMVSNTTPLNSKQGIVMTKDVKYPYKVSSNKTGTLYLRVRDDGNYADNTGYFDVMIQYRKYVNGGAISGVIESVKNLVRSMTFNAATQFFHNITCTGEACNCQSGNCKSQYVDYIRALLILYIAGYGLSFMIGFVQITQFDLFMRIIKVGLVMTLISDGSFDFFYNNFFNLFFDGMDDLIRMSQSGFSSASSQGDVFSFVDSMISLTILSKSTWLKVVGLMFTTPYGLLLSILLIVSIIIFLIGIFKAVVVYLVATLVIGILMLLAPIFIPFVLFQTTRHLFENWIKMFAQYTLEPIILLIGLSFMTQLLYQLFSEIVNFHVCWKCMWPINMPFIPSSTLDALGLSHTLFCLQFFGPFGLMPSGAALIPALGMEIADVVIVIILCNLILSYDSLVQQMVLRITGGEAAQFMSGGKQGQFSSVGSAATHMLSRASFRGVSAAGLAQGGKQYVTGSVRRAALRIVKGKTEEDKLLAESKKTDKRHREEIAERSSAFSSGLNNMMSTKAADEQKILKDPSASKDEKNAAAESVGRKLYESMGDKAEFKGLVNNLSTLSSLDDGSKAHGELSDQAKKMREALKGDSASSALSTLSSDTATKEEKKKAAGKLLKAIHEKDPSLHEAIHKDPLSDSSKKLVEEVNEIERKPRSSLRYVKDEDDERDEEDNGDE